MNAVTTFVIPSVGRPTLENTIRSLVNQCNERWKALVVLDGTSCSVTCGDPRVRIVRIEKQGTENYAGEVRNAGMAMCDTEWVSFVDDDDVVSPHYVERLVGEINLKKTLDAVVFRMACNGGKHVLPENGVHDFVPGNVGISFSFRRELFLRGIAFEPGGGEDFRLLQKIRSQGYRMVLSPAVTYYVQTQERPEGLSDIQFNRAYINGFLPRVRLLAGFCRMTGDSVINLASWVGGAMRGVTSRMHGIG